MINRAQPTPSSAVAVRVDFGGRGRWEVKLPDQFARVRCDTLDDARAMAHVCAERRGPCELIVCDAYHRVLLREFVTGDDGCAVSRR